ncbi:MAG: LamG domain-containing protein, partial [Bacteroidales bacterium]|nr:LamG domain-containing protein [Bacteroidales bacterium]
DLAKTLLPAHRMPAVKPEPLENLLYKIGLLYFPLSLLGLYHLCAHGAANRLLSKPAISAAIIYISCFGLLLLAFFSLRQPNPFTGAKLTVTDFHPTNFMVFCAPLLMAQKPLLYLAFIPAILGLFFGLSRLKPAAYKYTDLSLGVAVNLLALWLLVTIFHMHHYAFPDTWQGQFDLNSVYYSMTQTLAGSPVLIDGVSNTYGGYPLFLAPVFKLIGLDISNFTLVMAVLIIVCALCWACFLNRFSRSRLIAALGLLALLFFGYITNYLHDGLLGKHTFDSYFANAPIRWLSPTLTLLAAALYSQARRPILHTITYYGAAILLPLGIIWCPDFGLISCMAWLLFVLFSDFWAKDDQPRIAWKTELCHIAVWLGGILVSFGLFALVMRVAYGAWPDFRLLFHTAAIFSKIDFLALPMQACHPWVLVVLMLCTGLAYSIATFYRRQVTPLSAAVFLLSILGCGLFVYFKTRSYHSNLFQPALYAMMLGILLTDGLWRQIREKRIYRLWLPAALGLLLLGAAVPESLAAAKTLHRLTSPYHGNTPPEDKPRILENKAFIQQYTRKTDKVWILTSNKFQSFYFDKPLLQSAFNPGFLDLNTLADYERAKQTLRDSNFTVFLDGNAFYYSQWQDLRALVAARYVVDTQCRKPQNKSFSALMPRPVRIPETAILSRPDEQPLLYRKYTDDSAGYERRIQDASGVPLSLNEGQTFSLELLFFSTPQHYSRGTVFSQYTDSTGFGLFNVNEEDYTDLYGLACGQTQRLFQIPAPAWNYLVFNFLPDAIDLYVNTHYYGRIPLKDPYRPGTALFYVGSQTGLAHYIGGISEIAIHNRLQTEAGMAANYEKFRQSVSAR